MVVVLVNLGDSAVHVVVEVLGKLLPLVLLALELPLLLPVKRLAVVWVLETLARQKAVVPVQHTNLQNVSSIGYNSEIVVKQNKFGFNNLKDLFSPHQDL